MKIILQLKKYRRANILFLRSSMRRSAATKNRAKRMQSNSKALEFRALRIRIIFSSKFSDFLYISRVAPTTLNICNIKAQIAHLGLRGCVSLTSNTYLVWKKELKITHQSVTRFHDVEYASLHILVRGALLFGRRTDMIYTYLHSGMFVRDRSYFFC